MSSVRSTNAGLLLLAPVIVLLVTGTCAQSGTSPAGRDQSLPKSVEDLRALQTRFRAVVREVTPATVGVGGATGGGNKFADAPAILFVVLHQVFGPLLNLVRHC